MPIPARTGQQGRWSLRQAREMVPVPDRVLRSASRRALVSSEVGLDGGDLLAVRLLAACCLPARDAAVGAVRDSEIVQAAHRAWSSPSVTLVLVVTDAEARSAVGPDELVALTDTYSDRPRLLLPAGRWAVELVDRVVQARQAQGHQK
jgi:hypothetical protein